MDPSLNTKRILIFLAFAFGIPWAATLVINLTVKTEDLANVLMVANYIVIVPIPALACVATRLITREGWGHLWLRPNFRRGWRLYLAAWLLPLLAVTVGGAIFYLLFPQSFDPNFGELRKLLAGSPSAMVDNPWILLLSIAVNSIIIAVPLGAVVSIGEEFGWRAYLLPKLMERFSGAKDPAYAGNLNSAGARNTALLLGLIHGVWHWPLFFTSMRFDPGMSILTPLVYLVFTCSLSILLSWVTLRSGSVWPATVGHGTIRPYSVLVGVYPLKGPAIPLLGPDATGLIGGIGFTILALVLFFSRRAFAREKEAVPQKVGAVVITNQG